MSTEGEAASNITDLLRNLGFETTFGSYDFVYNWETKVEHKDIVSFMDTVQNKLKGMNVRFNITNVK